MKPSQPLAEQLRPMALDDVIGQRHLIGINRPLSLLANGRPQSIILWGPPGVGKTTLANILANAWDCNVVKLSAVFSGIKEIKESLEQASADQEGLFNKKTVIFVDEIHRFNKIQQDAFLHHLEDGRIVLIGATTENPSFELNNAILSRVQVHVLEPLTHDDLAKLLELALAKVMIIIEQKVRELIIELADGDGRKLINLVEMVANSGLNNVTVNEFKEIMPKWLRRFDKGGDDFYNQISALHKSVRGSDPDASLYWLQRMLESGADPLYLGRRMLRIAWEDIGLADINAANLVLNAINSYERLGSKEGSLALATAVIYLAVAPKSNSAEIAYNRVCELVAHDKSREVPIHLRNAPTKLMRDLNYGREYKYPHDYPNHYVANENYWPNDLKAQQFYTPTTQGLEQKITEKLAWLKKLK